MKAKSIELWPVERLIPYERNARTHSPEQVAQIAASIQEFGFTNPILVDSDDGILAGHGRLAAAKDLAMDQVPVIVLDHLSPAQRRAYVLADNKLALNAGWDEELLQQELAKLQIEDFDLDVLGFSEEEIARLLVDAEDQLSDYNSETTSSEESSSRLADRFGIPPFSVLNAREGWWQERKRGWLALGIKSELGRGAPIGGGADAIGSPGGGQRQPRGLDDASR